MAYSPPTVNAYGLSVPQYTDILTWLINQFQSIYGVASYLANDSADFQDIAVRALQAFDTGQALQAVYLGFNPQTATGASLDMLGRLIGTARESSSYSSALITITGTPGTVISNGVVRDVNSYYWTLATPITIGSGGTSPAIATCQTLGAIIANPGDISIIATPTAGWIGATNISAALTGNAVEPDSNYRARLLISQAQPSLTLLAGTVAAVAAVPGVTRSAVYENPTNVTDANENPPHSITCVVEGGVLANIGQAIYNNRGIGCDTNGTTTVPVVDPQNPAIVMQVSFDILGYVPVYVSLNIHALPGFSSATASAISADVVAYLNSVGIGRNVVYSELYGAALNARPNPDQPLFSIYSISSGAQLTQTSATLINGNPSITIVSATGIAPGQTIVGIAIPAGTTVVSITGTTVVMSANATANGTGVAVSTFALGTADISVAFNLAASGSLENVLVNLV
jgi:uncharacterized phage protein gp47/JayE